MNLDQLKNIEDLSLRAYNVCRTSNLRSLQLILNWYKKHGNFKNKRNCGSDTNKELTKICVKYIEQETISRAGEKKLINAVSKRAHNVCLYNKLSSVESLLDYFKSHGSFSKFRNCGIKTNVELVNFCRENIDLYSKNGQLNEAAPVFLVDEEKLGLSLLNAVSVRAYNVCLYNKLSSVESLFDYFKNHGSFSKFRNCGIKTNVELVNFCKENVDSFSKDVQLQEVEPFLIENLSRLQQRVIRYHAYSLGRNLPREVFRALMDFLGGPEHYEGGRGYLSLENMFNKILNNSAFDLRHFDFLGGNAIEKLAYFIKSYKDTVRSVSEISGKVELVNFNFRLTLNSLFPYFLLYDKLRDNTIFCAMQVVIENELLFEKKILKVFKNKFKIYNNSSIEFSIDNVNLSRERIRQICKIIQENLFKKTRFVKKLIDESLDSHDLFPDSDVIFIDQLLNEKINLFNHTDFSKEWNSYLIYVYFSNSFELVGLVEDVLFRKNQNSNGRHNWSCFYIVNNDATEVFDFLLFVNDFKLALDSSRIDSIYFNINNYVSEKLNISNADDILRISKIARFIIKHEFVLECDENDNFLLQKNTRMPFHECVYSALSNIGSQASVTEITSMVSELFPEELTSVAKVRAALKRKFGFVPVGRSSVFGLVHWENEFSNFKGGTIRSLVSDYLKLEGSPQHIDSITDFVRKYRPNTYNRSVWQNLRTDTTGVFVFSRDSFVGLESSNPNESKHHFNDFLPEKVKTWEQSFSDFVDFVSQNCRLPRSSGCPIEEIQLYRWYSIQIRSMDRGELDQIKSNQLRNVTDEFPIQLTRQRSSITKNIKKYESIIFDILRECPGQVSSKESLKEELVKISKLNSPSLDNILNKASYLKRRLCMAGRPFYYYHTSSDILDISRDHDNIQDFILTNIKTADFRLEYYYKAMQKMIYTPDPEIITGAIGRLISRGKISQFYHKFIDNDSEILMSNRMKAILDNLIMGICESMANRRDISFMMDREVYNNKFVNDFVSYLTICGVVQINLYEINIEIVYLINYNSDKVLLTNNIEALFLPFVLKNYFVANKMKCEFMVLGFNVKYNNRFNLISYE